MSTKAIEKRIAEGKPLTRPQKLRVLKDARALLEERWTSGSWVEMIDDVEHFCLYGAVAKSAGLDPEDEHKSDAVISTCSLTSTMFDALPVRNKHRVQAEKEIRRTIEDHEIRVRNYNPDLYYTRKPDEGALLDTIMALKVVALQSVNDEQGRAAVLRVVDKAIEALSVPA